MLRLPDATWFLLAGATSAAILLLRYPIELFPAHDVSIAALPVLTVALLGGPLVGALAAAVTAAAALMLDSMTSLLALLLLAAPAIAYAHARGAHPAYACLVAPVAASLVDALTAGRAADQLHLFTVGVLQSSISVIGAYGLSLLLGSRSAARRGPWAGRPLTHRLFVTLATVATLLTCGLGLSSASNLQERQVRSALANLRLLSLEIAESSQVMLRAHGRSLAAFGHTLVLSDLADANEELGARLAAYASSQSDFMTVLVARTDGRIIAAAATRPTLDVAGALGASVADRDYFRGAIAAGGPYVTDTFRGRGFGSDIIVGISAPIYDGPALRGVIEGSLDLSQLSSLLDVAGSRRGFDIVLVDRASRVVAARGPPLAAGDLFLGHGSSFTEQDLSRRELRQLLDRDQLGASSGLARHGWTVHVAQPVSSLLPMFEAQFRTVVRDMSVTLLGAFALSGLFAGLLARPLAQFGQALSEEAGQGGGGLLRAVRSAPTEIRRFALMLVRVQRRQRRSLLRQSHLVAEKDRLNQALQTLNVELDRMVDARTSVLAERERQLRSSETRWRTMAEIAPDAVIVIDEQNVIHFVNTATTALTGYDARDLLGQPMETILPERLRSAHRNGLQRYLLTGVPKLDWRSTEALVATREGAERPVEIAFGEYSLDGKRYFAGYLRDITVRKRNEAEVVRARDLAEAANRSKDAFLATMSHEIRTPLHGLIGTLDLMARGETDPRAAYRLKVARNSARSLLQLANDVLDLSGIEAGRVRIERVAFDLRDLVAAVTTSFEPGAVDKGLRLEHEIAADVPGWVEGDPLRVRQIIANLVNNALKFTSKGRVLLRLALDQGGQVTFDVIDTGIGVPDDKREHIFERFAQAEDERTRRFGGAGLGLAISRLLARAMGGELVLAGTSASGSTFRLTLPLPPARAEPDADTASTSRLHALAESGRPPRVLVVDDNPANRYVVEAYLQELGAEACLVESADAGIAELARRSFDLVLMDVQMPGKDGYQATREIRGRLGLQLPVVAMTANANIGERSRCEAAGMNDLLLKPFDVAGLAGHLDRFCVAGDASRAPSSPRAASAAAPLIDSDSPDSIARRFAAKPATLHRLYSALHESLARHLDAIRVARDHEPDTLGALLHGLKGAAGMYGAIRLQLAARDIESRLVAGTAAEALVAEFDALDQAGRLTLGAVHALLESLADLPAAGA